MLIRQFVATVPIVSTLCLNYNKNYVIYRLSDKRLYTLKEGSVLDYVTDCNFKKKVRMFEPHCELKILMYGRLCKILNFIIYKQRFAELVTRLVSTRLSST